MESLGFLKFVLAGQSFGAMVSFHVARKHPRHVAGIMDMAGIGLRASWGWVWVHSRVAAFFLHGISAFVKIHQEKSDEVLADLIRHPRKRAAPILQPHDP